MKPCLIVYYSRTGVTARVANALAERCGADLEQIQEPRPRNGASGFLRSAWQALRQLPADIAPPRRDPGDYAFIVLGTPVWAGHMSAPIRSYIAQQHAHFRRVGLFCTMGGSGGPKVLDAMAALCQQRPVASLCLRQRDVLADRHVQALSDFANDLLAIARGGQTSPPDGLARPT